MELASAVPGWVASGANSMLKRFRDRERRPGAYADRSPASSRRRERRKTGVGCNGWVCSPKTWPKCFGSSNEVGSRGRPDGEHSRSHGGVGRVEHSGALALRELPDLSAGRSAGEADRSSMAHGLELRSPLLDTVLVEYASRLPDSHLRRGRHAEAHSQGGVPRRHPGADSQARQDGLRSAHSGLASRTLASMVEERILSEDARIWQWLERDHVLRRARLHLNVERTSVINSGPCSRSRRGCSGPAAIEGASSPARMPVRVRAGP